VRILLVGNRAGAAGLADQPAAADLAVATWPENAPGEGGSGEIAAIAHELRALERELGDRDPDAVVVASDSSAALAAVLVATKLGTPVARLELAGGDSGGANARLIRQLADAAVAPEPAAILEWLRDTYTPRA
jgi:hypothetical protein